MTQARLRLLWSSNIWLCASGYGVQSASALPRFAELPEFGGSPGSWEGRKNIAQHAWYGLSGTSLTIDGFKVYQAGNDPYGNDVVGPHMKHWGGNLLISLIDVWVLRDIAEKVKPALWCAYLPIDHDPVPQRVLDSLQGCHLPITYAKWGHDMLTKAGVENVYVPHGVETGIFRVIPERDQVREFKAKFTKRDDTFLTLMVAANKGYPDRKAFQVQLRGWAQFAKDKPHARLHIHTEPTPMYGGIDFGALVANLGIADKVTFPDRYENFMGYPQERLALLYNTADVYMGAAMSEGFGIPLIESQSCGLPVITTNFSAMPELVRWGYAVDPLDMFWTPMNAWQAWPDAKGIAEKLEVLHAEWLADGGDWAMEKRIKTQDAIHSEYDWDAIVRDQWRPLITRLADEAPPLHPRFLSPGADVPQTHTDDVQQFVDAVQEGLTKERPKRRVGPLKPKEAA